MKLVNIKILVATHKQYWMPEDSVYMPIHVGREGKADIGYTGDHTGDNISLKNANYCELTGLYWAWKILKRIILVSFITDVTLHVKRYALWRTKRIKF